MLSAKTHSPFSHPCTDTKTCVAARTDNRFSVDCLAEEIGSIKITNYAYGKGTNSSYTIKSEGNFDLIDPIIIPADDITIK